jgi:phage major head subunit gpT-like protein
MNDLLLTAPVEFLATPVVGISAGSPESKMGAGGGSGGKACRINAYTGGPIRQPWSEEDIYVDLQGITWTDKNLPINADHNTALSGILGNTTSVAVDAKEGLVVAAFLNGIEDDCKKVIAHSIAGVQFQASIGAAALTSEYIRAGQVGTVNGRQVEGPAMIVRKTRLRHIAVVTNGADDNTMTKIAAQATQSKGMTMSAPANTAATPENTPAAPAAPQAIAAAAATPAAPSPAPAAPAAQTIVAQAAPQTPAQAPAPALQLDATQLDTIATMVASKISAASSVNDLRNSRPTPPNIIVSGAPSVNSTIIEAAAAIAGKLPGLEKHFDAKTLEMADKQYKGGISLCEIIHASAVANGYLGRNTFRDSGAGRAMLQAAWASNDLSQVLSATVNKFLLAGFMAVDNTWRTIAASRPVTDFKKVTSYRLTGSFEFEEMSGTSAFENKAASDLKYENFARTYGIATNISREQLINDDLGALTTMPQMIGRGGALKLNRVFWSLFTNNSSIFTAGNKNLIPSGASSAMSVDALSLMETTFLDQLDYDGQPLAANGEILLMPTALNTKGRQLMSQTEIRDNTSNKNYATTNPHAGKYQPVVCPYLNNASVAGANASATAFYVLANPSDLALIEVCFLGGVEQPTIEQAEADFSVLGIRLRGFWDFGVAFVEPKAAVKSPGA